MKRAGRILAVLCVVAVVVTLYGCGSGDCVTSATQPTVTARATYDGVHKDAVEGFFFLPPLAPDPNSTGAFDPDLAADLKVEIFLLGENGEPTAAPVATFTDTATTNKSEAIRVNTDDEHYIVNFHTRSYDLVDGAIYRIFVRRLDGTQYGFADVKIVTNRKQTKSPKGDTTFALKDGRTLPIKFRVEVGATPPSYDYVFAAKWGSAGSGAGEFNSPHGVGVDADGNVYVADTFNHRIQKFTATGTFIAEWGSYGSGNGQFRRPIGVAVDAHGNVFVTDGYNHRIQKFTSTGTFIAEWGSSGYGNGRFRYPYAVAVDAAGNVYVTEVTNARSQKFNGAGDFIIKWGSYGSGDGEFNGPAGVAVDADGNVYVTDHANDRIQKFTSSGTFLTKWDSYGSGDGQFDGPHGVAVDLHRDVYVADSQNHRIQKFSGTATLITKWGSSGSGDGEFWNPGGVAVDADGSVYVADRGNNRIQKFRPEAP